MYVRVCLGKIANTTQSVYEKQIQRTEDVQQHFNLLWGCQESFPEGLMCSCHEESVGVDQAEKRVEM